jgi:hypothetical protein
MLDQHPAIEPGVVEFGFTVIRQDVILKKAEIVEAFGIRFVGVPN